jgi:hypothetical protein
MGMDIYKTLTKMHNMEIKYHVVNEDNSFKFVIPVIDGIAEIIINKSDNSIAYLSTSKTIKEK